jgi:hypothetical protein
MRTTWTWAAIALGCLVAAHGALAQPGTDALPGTWECYGPGQTSPRTPPIVYFAPAESGADGKASLFIDGFARKVNGRASVAEEADALRVSTDDASLRLRDISPYGRTVRMELERDGVGSYHCYRLPRLTAQADVAPPAGLAPETAPVPQPRSFQPIAHTYQPIEVPPLDPAAPRP